MSNKKNKPRRCAIRLPEGALLIYAEIRRVASISGPMPTSREIVDCAGKTSRQYAVRALDLLTETGCIIVETKPGHRRARIVETQDVTDWSPFVTVSHAPFSSNQRMVVIRRGTTRFCLTCFEPFYCRPSQMIGKNSGKFCSYACRTDHRVPTGLEKAAVKSLYAEGVLLKDISNRTGLGLSAIISIAEEAIEAGSLSGRYSTSKRNARASQVPHLMAKAVVP